MIYQKSNIFLFLIALILHGDFCFSQNQLSGNVYSAKDSIAIFGASVYFDGTSIGVSTNDKGYFQIPFKEYNSSLIISCLGYEPIIINSRDLQNTKNLSNIYLKEKFEQLEIVNIEPDPWTRLKKLRIFKKEFLGANKMALACEIINEDSIELRYIPSTKTLVASSEEPLIIENKYLGYVLKYNLTNFQVHYKISNGYIVPNFTYYEGFSFFEPLKKQISRRILKNREKSYLGSSLHFMRSLYDKKLDENNFKIFFENFQVPTYKYLTISEFEKLKRIKLLVDEVEILYKDTEISGLEVKSEFSIDYLGNHTPIESVILSGEISKKRISELLPLNYKLK